MTDLRAELASAAKSVRVLHFRALEAFGVNHEFLCDLWRHGYGFGIVKAVGTDEGLWHPSDEGEPHLVLPVYDEGVLIDLCAFRSSDPKGWLLRTGEGWALGIEGGLERHTWGDPVQLAVSPLEWLQQGGAGLCVLDWDAPEVRYLLGVPRLVCSSHEHAGTLRKALSTPVRFPEISVMEMRLAA